MAVSESKIEKLAEVASFGGFQLKFQHTSSSCNTTMKFSLFVPGSATPDAPVPVLMFLSGLTCNEDNFAQKSGAQVYAQREGIAVLMPDTSPRGDGVADGAPGEWDLGIGAGFYVDATKEPWSNHYSMFSYVTEELPKVAAEASGLCRLAGDSGRSLLDVSRLSVSGHSMGGHGALVAFLKRPGRFASCSAFAPICHPTACPWGEKAFSAYLGTEPAVKDAPASDPGSWAAHDASELLRLYSGPPATLLVDQGGADGFLAAGQLQPEALLAAAEENDAVAVEYRLRELYDHSYFFVASFVEEHICFHARALTAAGAAAAEATAATS